MSKEMNSGTGIRTHPLYCSCLFDEEKRYVIHNGMRYVHVWVQIAEYHPQHEGLHDGWVVKDGEEKAKGGLERSERYVYHMRLLGWARIPACLQSEPP
jgi:hypothetical protein